MKAPKQPKLKVFRTPIGFHDAYVAVPSQKAAIEAWGAGKDVFARGEAEQVTDPELMEAPLASPGVVIKRLRGTLEENLAALPEAPAPAKPRGSQGKAAPKQSKKVPKPSRAQLDAAEQAIEKAEQQHAQALELLAEQEAELQRQRRELAHAYSEEMGKLETAREQAAAAHRRAMEKWQAS